MKDWLGKTLSTIGRQVVDQLFQRSLKDDKDGAARPSPSKKRATAPASTSAKAAQQPADDYPGDFVGSPTIEYAPVPGDDADPGEVVWTWVPFEEDYTQGKDRPVLIIGRDAPWLLALQLTSQDHDRDAAQEARQGRRWVDIGSGAWDPQGRPSEVRVNRIIRVDPTKVRRIGAVLAKPRFDVVAAAVGPC